MKFIRYKSSLLISALIVMQICFLTYCHTKSYDSNQQTGKIGFIGFYLDMDYIKVKSIIDSLLNISELHYFEATDIAGNKQKNLYYDFSGISPFLCAKVNLNGTYIIDERLTSIQLTLCSRTNKGEQLFSYDCALNEIKKLFEVYREKYGTATLLDQGERYDWLSKKVSNVYLPGPKGRLLRDKIYFWERGNYIIYFDFGYPKSLTRSDNPVAKSDVHEVTDSTSVPIIYYVFAQDYIDKLLEKASKMKQEEFK
jgi:hypothetical protein